MKRYPEYKESGLEWIGEIPKAWELKRLKYVMHLNMGQSPPSEEYNREGFGMPFLQGSAEFGQYHPAPETYCPSASKHASPGDILISVRAPVGAINVADRGYGIGRGLCAIRPRSNHVERHYAEYLLEVVRTELDVVSNGSIYDAVTVRQISNITCVVPPLSEQRKIANFLDRKTKQIDELIRVKERKIELLKEYRASLIHETVTKGLDPNAEMKPSGLEWIGEIPKAWELKRLKYVMHLNMGQSPPSEEYNREGLGMPFLQGSAEFGQYHPAPETYCPSASKHASPGDILISVRAPVGAINVADREYGIGRGLCAIRPRTNHVERHYAEYLLEVVSAELDVVSNGSIYNAVTVRQISNVTCVVPPLPEQTQIANFLGRKTKLIDELRSNEEQIVKLLKEYRQSLISEAVTGKIDVRSGDWNTRRGEGL